MAADWQPTASNVEFRHEGMILQLPMPQRHLRLAFAAGQRHPRKLRNRYHVRF